MQSPLALFPVFNGSFSLDRGKYLEKLSSKRIMINFRRGFRKTLQEHCKDFLENKLKY